MLPQATMSYPPQNHYTKSCYLRPQRHILHNTIIPSLVTSGHNVIPSTRPLYQVLLPQATTSYPPQHHYTKSCPDINSVVIQCSTQSTSSFCATRQKHLSQPFLITNHWFKYQQLLQLRIALSTYVHQQCD